jgi:hypothetical protein
LLCLWDLFGKTPKRATITGQKYVTVLLLWGKGRKMTSNLSDNCWWKRVRESHQYWSKMATLGHNPGGLRAASYVDDPFGAQSSPPRRGREAAVVADPLEVVSCLVVKQAI